MDISRVRVRSPLAFGLLFLALAANAAEPRRVTPMTPDVVEKYEQTLPSADFIRREAMVPMRDGVKLYTVTVMKKGSTNAPILLSRTPYDAHGSTHRVASQRIVVEVIARSFQVFRRHPARSPPSVPTAAAKSHDTPSRARVAGIRWTISFQTG